MTMENNEENKDQDMFDDSEEGGMKQWFRDNLRIIISVLIVAVIAGGIYSYSKRTETPVAENQEEQSDTLEKIAGAEDSSDQAASTQEKAPETTQESQGQAQKETPTKAEPKSNISSTATSQETDKSFIETAGRGDGSTKLARRALANYLEKNPDSSLTPEHKIYIEDYLRKRVSKDGRMNIGTSVEFQKSLIQDAITKSKGLTEKQLQNLHKYAVRVPSLS